jgi:hypothetical protein
MTDIKRHDLCAARHCNDCGIEEHPTGDYVLFSDHQARIDALVSARDKAISGYTRLLNEKLRGEWRDAVEAIEALKFYGDTANYEARLTPQDCGCCSYPSVAVEEDKGTRARAAIAELEAKP